MNEAAQNIRSACKAESAYLSIIGPPLHGKYAMVK